MEYHETLQAQGDLRSEPLRGRETSQEQPRKNKNSLICIEPVHAHGTHGTLMA